MPTLKDKVNLVRRLNGYPPIPSLARKSQGELVTYDLWNEIVDCLNVLLETDLDAPKT